MSTAPQREVISVETFLAREELSPIKHEYEDGVVHAMAGARAGHNRTAMNVLAALHLRLRDRPCEPFGSDMMVRIAFDSHVRLYYPDAMVVCGSTPGDARFIDDPSMVFEVLSKTTREADEGKKRDAYLTIPTLAAYVMIEQQVAAVTVLHRTPRRIVRKRYKGTEAILRLPEIEIEIPLSEIYARVTFAPESSRSDDR